MCIQRFSYPSYPIARSLILRSFGFILLHRNYSVLDHRSLMIESLKKFDNGHLQINILPPKFKITVRNPIFRGMPLDAQHKLVVDLLPEHIRNDVVVESSALLFENDVVVESSSFPEVNIDREVRRVHVNKEVPFPPDGNIPATPQTHLDTAVYHLSKQSGAMASESLWLCGSLALKNFCVSNGFNPKLHMSKSRIVKFLKRSFNEFHSQLDSSWDVLNLCHQNAYEDEQTLDKVHEFLKSVELFCNTLFDIHDSKQFKLEEFKKSLPESMTKEGNVYFDFN